MNQLIKRTYLNPDSVAYLGSQALVYRESKKLSPKSVTYAKIKSELAKQRVYGLHKQIRRKFSRNKTFAAGLDTDWQLDLADLSSIADQNDGYRYLLVCVDVFSRYAFVEPIRSKQPNEMIRAFQTILTNSHRSPWAIFSDRGGEFLSSQFKKFLESHDIIQKLASNTETKAAICERYIRSLKDVLWKHFTYTQSSKYLKILPKLVHKLNRRIHRVTGMRPVDVTYSNENLLRKKLYGDSVLQPIKFKFAVNDKVRISLLKRV